jgi:hypothetical protein
MADQEPIPREGWNGGPNGRGTMDVIWTCVGVLLLASYALVRLNPTRMRDSDFKLFLRKVKWAALALFAPEFITQVAWTQWSVVRKIVPETPEKSWVQAWYYYMVRIFFRLQ